MDLENYYVIKLQNATCGYIHLCKLSYSYRNWNYNNYNYLDYINKNINIITRIHQVAVKKEFLRQGLASFAYKNLFKICPENIFCAFVVTKPYFNIASTNFHKSLGFTEIAYLNGNNNNIEYEHTLFIKQHK